MNLKWTIYLLRDKFGEIPHRTEHPKIQFLCTEMSQISHLQHLLRKQLHWCVNYPYLAWLEKKEIQIAYSLICLASEYKKD